MQVCGVYKTEKEANAKVLAIKHDIVYNYYHDIMVSGLTRKTVSEMSSTELDSAIESHFEESCYRKVWDVQQVDFIVDLV